MVETNCEICGKIIRRGGSRPGRFCSLVCKGKFQEQAKPVTREWLYQKYAVEGLGTLRIAKMVNRDPKRVYEWLIGLDIPTRTREWEIEPGGESYHNPEWLKSKYIDDGLTMEQIAAECNCTTANIKYFMAKFGIKRRSMNEIRATKHWGSDGPRNPMYGKRGAEVPNWKGGCTPERQAFYSTDEWKEVSKLVWKRDKATCQRCGLVKHRGVRFNIHHIVSFSVKELRVEPKNLVLLCHKCHRFVHSRKNTDNEFRKEVAKQ